MGIETPPEAAGSVSPTSAETLDAPDFGAGRWDRRSKPEKNGARSHDTRPQQKLQSPTAVEKAPEKKAEKATEKATENAVEKATEKDALRDASLASADKKDNTQDVKKELRKIRKTLREIDRLERQTDINKEQMKKKDMKANLQARLEELERISDKGRSSD